MRSLYNIYLHATALFKNSQILKFKSQQTLTFFTAINHLSRPLTYEKELYLKGFKESWFVICEWWISICVFLCFKVCCL